MEGFFFEQAVEHTPGESAVAAPALECQVQNSRFTFLNVLPFGPICFVEECHVRRQKPPVGGVMAYLSVAI